MGTRYQTCLVMSATPAAVVCAVFAACHRCWLDIQLRSYPQYVLLPQHLATRLPEVPPKYEARSNPRNCVDRNMPDAFDVYDTYDRGGCGMNACHRCWFDIPMRSYPQNVLLPQHLVALLIKVRPYRAITRDYVDRHIPDVLDAVYDTYGRDGRSNNACHRCLLDMQMRSYLQSVLFPQHLVALLLH